MRKNFTTPLPLQQTSVWSKGWNVAFRTALGNKQRLCGETSTKIFKCTLCHYARAPLWTYDSINVLKRAHILGLLGSPETFACCANGLFFSHHHSMHVHVGAPPWASKCLPSCEKSSDTISTAFPSADGIFSSRRFLCRSKSYTAIVATSDISACV